MKFEALALEGAFRVCFEPFRDERGSFARVFCVEEFAAHGLDPCTSQTNVSSNAGRGTLRGLHFQAGCHAEAKLVRCSRGAIWDVAADVRPGSLTFGRWCAVELCESRNAMVYWPPGVAHGFLSLADASEVTYQTSRPYAPCSERGVRWDDPAFAIDWPGAVRRVSQKDRSWPDFACAMRRAASGAAR